jgi:hypothetical protein
MRALRADQFLQGLFFALGLALLGVPFSAEAQSASVTDQPAGITSVSQPFIVDGATGPWLAIPSVPITGTSGEIGQVKLAYDGNFFYALFIVPDKSPLKNAASSDDPAMMLKGGDALGLTFGPADGKGMRQRILFTLLDGQPAAVVYRPESPEKKPRSFESPVGKVNFDYVAPLPEARVGFKITPTGYTAEIGIPWSVLGFTPRHGLEFPFDAQIIQSDEAGQHNVATGWWHSIGPGPMAFIDLPTEAQLYPNLWGKARFLSPGEAAPSATPATASAPKIEGIPIRFTLPRPAKVSLQITTDQGWILRELCVATLFPAGDNTITWDGRDEYGDPLPAGDYHWRLAYFDGIGCKRIGGAGSTARPPYRTADGKGDLGAVHGMPAALAADAEGVYHLGGTEEGNPGLTKLGLDGIALWKRSLGGFGTGFAMAANDKIAAMVVRAQKSALLITMDPKTGRDLPVVTKGLAKFVLGDDKLNVAGLALCGTKAYFGLPDTNQIGVLDLETGTRAPELSVPSPTDVRPFDDTHLLVVSKDQVLKIDVTTGQQQIFASNLKSPCAVARDSAGNVYVSEWGDSQQIVKFSPDGKEVARLGVAGGRPATCSPYDPRMLRDVDSLCLSPDGNLWFMERSSLRRVGVMTTDGQWKKDIFQTLPSQAGAGVDRDDPSRVFIHLGYDSQVVQAKIDFVAAALDPTSPATYWKIERLDMLTETGDYTPPGPDDVAAMSTNDLVLCPIAFTGTNGKRYLWQEGPTASLWMEVAGRRKPVMVIGTNRLEGTLFPKGKPFCWSDANGDNLAQANEIDFTPGPGDGWCGIDRDLVLYGNGGKLKPYKVDERGVPYYRRSDWEPEITSGKPVAFYFREGSYGVFNSSPAPDGARYAVFNIGPGTKRSFWDRGNYNRIARIKDGRIQWIAGLHDGGKSTPGGAVYLWRPLGEVDGTVVVGDVDFQLFAYTSDGFGLGAVTPHYSQGTAPESIVQENVQSGYFVKDPATGKRIVVVGSGTEAFALEVTGIDPQGIARMEGSVHLDRTSPHNEEMPGQYSIPYSTWPKWANGRWCWVTGNGWGWRPEVPWLTIRDGAATVGEVRLRRDAGALEIYATVMDPAPLPSVTPGPAAAVAPANGLGKSPGLEVLIGPAAPETRTAPVAGDTRFFLTATRDGDKVKGVLLASRPANGGPDAAKWMPVPGVHVAACETLNGYGYHLEAEIPLTFLPELCIDKQVTYIRDHQPGPADSDWNQTYTESKPDLIGPLRLNLAIWQSAAGGMRRIPWLDDGVTASDPAAMNPSRWGVAVAPEPDK